MPDPTSNPNIVARDPETGEKREDLDILIDGERPATISLGKAGYSEGDFGPGRHVGVSAIRTFRTPKTDWAHEPDQLREIVRWNNDFPAGVQGGVEFKFSVSPGPGETTDVRLFNLTDNETVLEKTDITTADDYVLGPVAYTPSTESSPVVLVAQIQTDPGTNASELIDPSMALRPRL